MGRTAVNVAGQALVPTLVARQEGILDEAVYNRHRPVDVLASPLAAAHGDETAPAEA